MIPNNKRQAVGSNELYWRSTRLLLLTAYCLVLIPCLVWSADKPNSCIECHSQFESDVASPTQEMGHDVHFLRGLSCADCHGGDPTSSDSDEAMSPEAGFIGSPSRQEIPQFCARCHADPSYMRRYNPNLRTDQYAKYLTSQHGKRNNSGDKDAAVCTSCHGAHGIRSPNDPSSPVYSTNIPGTCAKCHIDTAMMKRHGLPSAQYLQYTQSVHGQALLVKGDRSAPHCASCHGSHEAARPGTSTIGNVCAQCHSLMRDLFAASPHKAAHEALGLPECEVCHGNHLIIKPTDEMLGVGPGALCVTCHEKDSPGFTTAKQMREAIEQVKDQIASADALVTKASQLGMDVSEGAFSLNEATTKLTQARAYVHSFSLARMEPIAKEGLEYAGAAKEEGQAAIHEYHFRRHGLWVTLAILILLVGGLLLKIREIERTQGSK